MKLLLVVDEVLRPFPSCVSYFKMFFHAAYYTITYDIILARLSHYLGNNYGIIRTMKPRQKKTFSVMAAFDLSSEAGRRKISGLYRFLSEGHDWNLTLLRSAEDLTTERIEQAARHGVDGFLIAIPSNDEIRTLHRRLEVPTVFTDYPDKALEQNFARCAFVFDDDSSLGSAAVRHFITQGKYKSYAYAEADNIRPWNQIRGESFISGMAAHGMKVDVFKHTDTRPADEIAAWLSSLPHPSGVLASFDDVARVLLEACRMARLKVPDDVAVLGIGNDPLICEHTVPQLSSVVPRFEDEGYRAARELQAMMISGRTPQRREITFGAQGVEERKSTARTQQGGALVQRGLAFIAKNVLSGITVSDVVQHLNISWRLADLRFKEVTGATIQSAIVDARLERVKKLLTDSDMRVSDIAQRCGCDPGVLRNLFRRHCGISMRDFRASARGTMA
jgi:LacI family transcriptional regulator